MIKRVLSVLALVLAAPAAAEGETLDINLSSQALRMNFAGPLSDVFPRVSGLYDVGAIYGEEEGRNYLQGHGGLLVTGDAGARNANVTAGLGGRLVALDVDEFTGGALALGGMVEGRLPAFNRLGAVAYVYGAPKASAFGDLEGWLEYSLGIDYQVLRSASIFVGYRQVKIDVKDVGEATVDNGWHFGLRLSF